jgi:hypothetical protein
MPDTKVPREYFVDLTNTTYRGQRVPNIRETVHEAFSPEQALTFVLQKNGCRYLAHALLPEVDSLVVEIPAPPLELSDHGPVKEPAQGELFDFVESDGFTTARPKKP